MGLFACLLVGCGDLALFALFASVYFRLILLSVCFGIVGVLLLMPWLLLMVAC